MSNNSGTGWKGSGRRVSPEMDPAAYWAFKQLRKL